MSGMSTKARRWTIAGAAATAIAVTGVSILLLGGGTKERPAADSVTIPATDPVTTTTSAAPGQPALTTTGGPAATTTTRSTTKPATSTNKPTKTTNPPPTAHPVTGPVPPPPHPAPVPGCAPTFTGTNAPKADVRAALVAAAGRQYWTGVANPPLVAVDPPEGTPPPATEQLGAPAVITVPPVLMQAIAWQESGWQSAIKACDGGMGTMQIMSPTASWMNQRFGTSNDFTTLSGNVAIGAQYLQWLIAYFGENNFGHHYNMTDPDLITAVIVGYNAGAGAVTFAGGHTVASSYATTVKALMNSQPWG